MRFAIEIIFVCMFGGYSVSLSSPRLAMHIRNEQSCEVEGQIYRYIHNQACRYDSMLKDKIYKQVCNQQKQYKVALCIMATGKYIVFVKSLIESARHYFLTGHKVTYIVFTDYEVDLGDDVIVVQQNKLGWPFDSCYRAKSYLKCNLLSEFDYVFACDVDMIFVNKCGDEILSERVGVLHAGFLTQRGSYETDMRSVACVSPNEGTHYFAGGMYGGTAKEFFKLNTCLSRYMDTDQQNGIMAVWHDESYLNRYFIDNPPTKILSCAYCYPQPPLIYDGVQVEPRLIALNKQHAYWRA